jgi:hypothetical protein
LGFAQEIKTTDFFGGAKQFDFSDLWTLDKFQIETGTVTVRRSRPLGFIAKAANASPRPSSVSRLGDAA